MCNCEETKKGNISWCLFYSDFKVSLAYNVSAKIRNWPSTWPMDPRSQFRLTNSTCVSKLRDTFRYNDDSWSRYLSVLLIKLEGVCWNKINIYECHSTFIDICMYALIRKWKRNGYVPLTRHASFTLQKTGCLVMLIKLTAFHSANQTKPFVYSLWTICRYWTLKGVGTHTHHWAIKNESFKFHCSMRSL